MDKNLRWQTDAHLGNLPTPFRFNASLSRLVVLSGRAAEYGQSVLVVPMEFPNDGCKRLYRSCTQSSRCSGIWNGMVGTNQRRLWRTKHERLSLRHRCLSRRALCGRKPIGLYGRKLRRFFGILAGRKSQQTLQGLLCSCRHFQFGSPIPRNRGNVVCQLGFGWPLLG